MIAVGVRLWIELESYINHIHAFTYSREILKICRYERRGREMWKRH